MAEERPTQSDPSALTTSLVWREIQHVKELFEARISAVEKAIEVAHQDLVRVPTEVEKAVQTLKELHDEKFDSVKQQFAERDVRVEQSARDTKTAVDAALAAQEKAVGKQNEAFTVATQKSDDQFTKQIDQQGELLRTEVRGMQVQLNELKDRMNRGEGRGEGVEKRTTDTRGSMGLLIALAAVAISAVVVVVNVILSR